MVALGGGKILTDEFKTDIEKTVDLKSSWKWHLFEPTTRRKFMKDGDVTKEEVEICDLVAINHPRLIKHT